MKFRVSCFAFLVACAAFGQSITATKAYVDRKYAEATNAVPAIVTNEVSIGWSDEWRVKATDSQTGGEMKNITVVRYDDKWSPSAGGMVFDVPKGDEESVYLEWIDANYYIVKAWRIPKGTRNALGLAMAKDVEKLPDHETVTNVARAVVNTVWDASLGVAWEARMHNGHLYYIAVTNRPPEVK